MIRSSAYCFVWQVKSNVLVMVHIGLDFESIVNCVIVLPLAAYRLYMGPKTVAGWRFTMHENTLAYINTKLQGSKIVPQDRHRKPDCCCIGQAPNDDVFIPSTDDKYLSPKRQHERFRYFEEGPRWTKHGSVKLSCQLWPYRAGIHRAETKKVAKA